MTSAGSAELAPPSALDALAQRALDRLAALPDVTRAGLAISEGGRRQLLFTATDRRDASGVYEWCHIDATADVPLNVAVSRGELVAGDPDELAARFPAFASRQREGGVPFLAAVPVIDVGEPLGGFVLYYDRPQHFDVRRRRELVSIGGSIGAGLAQARRDQRRRAADAWDDVATGPDDAPHATYEMPGDERAVGDARRFLRRTLEGWDVEPDLVDDAVLCLAELVTNAVVHTHAGCRIEVWLADDVVSVRVIDHGGLGPVRLAPMGDVIAAHGRGLGIVSALAARMGRDPERCLAWFEIDLRR